MDQMENSALPPESEFTPETPQPPVEKVRRSPYENSPYIMSHRQPEGFIQEPAPAAKPKKEKRRGRFWPNLLSFLLGAAVALGGVYAVTQMLQEQTELRVQALESRIDVLQAELENRENVSAGNSVSGTPNVSAGGMTPGQVYAANEQSVVLIDTDTGTGSGFIITEDGYVVTNYHVVEGASNIDVVLYDNSSYAANLTGFDSSNDVAVLKMEGTGFRSVKLGSSDDLIVGDQVVAIGNPLGELTSTLTAGYISAKERDVSTDTTVINMIQTDCAINSGNSGGPLFNMRGEVVGITTAKYSGLSTSGASIEGIGFAIPVDDVKGIVEDLMEFGYVKSAYLGVTVYTVQPSDSEMYGRPRGCLVNEVTPGSCADTAGLKKADVIIDLGGTKIEGYTDLVRILRTFDGGETTTITVDRGGQTLVLEITLDAKPHEEQAAPEAQAPGMPESGSYEEWFEYFFGD